jgi:HSP20 family molecular chaperone IbpA
MHLIDREVTSMTTQAKRAWIGFLFLACGIAIGALGYYALDLRQQVNQMQANTTTDQQPAMSTAPLAQNWDPNGQFARMEKRMDDIMRQMMPNDPLLSQNGFSQLGFGLSPASPEVTMDEDSDEYKVVVKVPEGENLQLNTDLADNTLTISGKVESSAQEDDPSGKLLGKAESMSQFSQTITLNHPVDEAGMKIDRDGDDIVITIPKRVS